MTVAGPARFQSVTPEALPLLEAGLKALAADLGDPYALDAEGLRRALFGPHPSSHGLLARGADHALWGVALYSPVLSTATGGAGVYVSDLWVAEAARGRGLGASLLSQVGARAAAMWEAKFIKLMSYAGNSRARAFYARMGFAERPDELPLLVPLEALKQTEE